MTTHISGAFVAIGEPRSAAVIQRSSETSGTIAVRTETSEPGRLFARVRKADRTLPKLDWRQIGESDGTIATGEITGVPIGGEYTLDLQVRKRNGDVAGHATVSRLLVGDLWITAGQSNMDGWGKLVGTEPPSRMVHAFSYDDRWDTAKDPLCWYHEAIDPVHWTERDPVKRAEVALWDRAFRQAGAGPAVAFGKAIAKRTGVPIGLIVCSHGGTSMEQWDPAKRGDGGESLYGSMIRRACTVGGKVAGIIWYQGESDANTQVQPLYREHMKGFVAALRRDLGIPALPIVYAQIGPFFTDVSVAPPWNAIQYDQLAIEPELAPAAMAATIDLGLDDIIHLSSASGRRLGRRLAHLAEMLVYGRTALKRGPRPASVRFADPERTVLRIRFTDVNVGLYPTSGIRGFSARSGERDLAVAETEVDPNQQDTVVIRFAESVPADSRVWYGRGVNPVVNLVDETDLAVPMFGPVTV